MVLSHRHARVLNGEDSAILTIFALSVPLVAEMQVMLFFLFSDKSCLVVVVALQWIRLLVELRQQQVVAFVVVEGALAREQCGLRGGGGGKPILAQLASEV